MLQKITRIIISIIFIGWFFYYLIRNYENFAAVLDISLLHIIIIGSGVLLTLVVNNIQSMILLREEGTAIGFGECLLLSAAAILANHSPFRLGTVFRLHYLKKIHGVRFARSGSIFSIRLISAVFMTGILGLFGIIVGYVRYGQPINKTICVLFFLLIITSLFLYVIPKPKIQRFNNKFVNVFNDFIAGFESVRKKHSLVLTILLLNFFRFVIMAGRFYYTFQAIQISIPIWVLFLIAPATTLATIISILPAGNLGLRESMIGYLTTISGQEFKTGFFAGTVDRAILFTIIILLGTVGLFYCWGKLKNKKLNTDNPRLFKENEK